MDAEKEVLRQLSELSVEHLKLVHTELGLTEISDDNKKESDSYIRKMIIRHLSSDEVVEVEDEGLSTYLHLNTFIKTLTPKDPKDEKDGKPVDIDSTTAKKTDLTDVEDDTVVAQSVLKKKSDSDKQKDLSTLKKQQEDILRNSFWKKDLKIKGQIGGPGEKGKLNFISVVRKIERALHQGYSETEVCEAVIEMISPEQKLRSLLDGKFDLNLPTLRRFLRSHFKEAEATELYNQLCNLSQDEGTSPDDFVQEAIVLRDKILFSSKEDDTEFQYTEVLVQKQCTHAIVTGLRNDNIKFEVKAALTSGKHLKDEELMEIVSKSVKEEKERQRKLKSSKSKTGKVNVVSEKEDVEDKKHQNKENPIVAELKELRAELKEISTLKTDVEVLKECVRNIGGGKNPNGYQGGRKVQFGCDACKEQNLFGCNHCFKCGEPGHKKPECPN